MRESQTSTIRTAGRFTPSICRSRRARRGPNHRGCEHRPSDQNRGPRANSDVDMRLEFGVEVSIEPLEAVVPRDAKRIDLNLGKMMQQGMAGARAMGPRLGKHGENLNPKDLRNSARCSGNSESSSTDAKPFESAPLVRERGALLWNT